MAEAIGVKVAGTMTELDVVALTKQLVAIDSVTSRSNAAIIDALEPILRGIGCETERIPFRDAAGVEKVNLVGRKGQGKGGLGFFSHVDTVPGIGWDRDPWSPLEQGDHLIGLGSCDMKGPLAATIVAAAMVDAAHLTRPIVIAATGDEETTLQGAYEVLNRSHLLRESALSCGVIAEPTRLIPIIAHKGGATVRVTAHGVAAHTSTDRGVSANFKIAPFLAEMAIYAEELRTDTSYHRPEFDPPTLAFNMTLDDGGCKQNVTAPKSVCTLSFRPMPHDRSDDVIAHILARAVDYGFETDVESFAAFGTSEDAAIVRAAKTATGASRVESVPYGTEAAVYQAAMELVVLGPGDIAQAHTKGEWISIPQLRESVTVYSRLIETFCTQ